MNRSALRNRCVVGRTSSWQQCIVFLDRFVLGGYPVIRSSKLLIVFVAVGDIIISLLSYACEIYVC